MTVNTLSVTLGTLALLTLLPTASLAEKPVTRRGTSVLHYMVRGDLHPTNETESVVGYVRLQANKQGHSSKQSLNIRLSELEPNAAFQLLAVAGDDTNAFVVADLTSNAYGNARVSYKSRGQGRGGQNPVPDSLLPLTNVRALSVDNAATQTVAYVWVADAAKFQYLVKRNLTPDDTNGPAAGSISLMANHNRVKLRLLAGGLDASGDYHLALNSEIHATVQADEDGRIEIREWPANAPGVLDLRSLAIWDAGSNVVLRTSLPR